MDDWLMPGIPRTIADEPDMETVRRIRASVTSDTGQVVESDMLLPCPFCSGKPYVQTYELGDTCAEARVVCPRCHVSTRREYQSWRVCYGGDDITRTLAIGRAISSWNRRAERTCRAIEFVEEETFGTGIYFECSECHETLGTLSKYGSNLPSYCPNCGARMEE